MTTLADRIAEVLKAELATWTDHQGNWFVHADNENVSIAALAQRIADAIEPSTDERCKSYGPASGEQCVKQVGHLTAHESDFRSTWE